MFSFTLINPNQTGRFFLFFLGAFFTLEIELTGIVFFLVVWQLLIVLNQPWNIENPPPPPPPPPEGNDGPNPRPRPELCIRPP